MNCEVSILIYVSGLEASTPAVQDWMKYYCAFYNINGKSFELILEPISTKFSQQVVNLYGKTCRASFGDARCGIDLSRVEDKVCDKSYSMCCNKYKNAINFRGEPFLPTYMDILIIMMNDFWTKFFQGFLSVFTFVPKKNHRIRYSSVEDHLSGASQHINNALEIFSNDKRK